MKKTNKGFSLVELIIVIAIMAILAGAIAPALIRYIDKSRRSNDVTSAKAVKTAVETALGNEDVYEVLTNVATGSTATVIELDPGVATNTPSAETDTTTTTTVDGNKYGVKKITGCAGIPAGTDITNDEICEEIAKNIGEKMPKTKFKKSVKTEGDATIAKPETFYAVISAKGTVYVGVAGKSATVSVDSDGKLTGAAQLTPNCCKSYQ